MRSGNRRRPASRRLGFLRRLDDPNLARRVVGDAEHGEVLDLRLDPVSLDDPGPPRPGIERFRVLAGLPTW